MVGGYDALISEAAQSQVDGLRTPQLVRYKLAIDSLLHDPTVTNPRVVLVDFEPTVHVEGLDDLTWALVYGDVVVTFTFMNALVVVVLYVDTMPPSLQGRGGPRWPTDGPPVL